MAVKGIDYKTHFPAPENYLEGSVFAVAFGYIDGARKDMAFAREVAEKRGAYGPVRKRNDEELHRIYDEYENRLDKADGTLAVRLAAQARAEVAAVEAGERLVVTGQAHLLPERSGILRGLVSQTTAVDLLTDAS